MDLKSMSYWELMKLDSEIRKEALRRIPSFIWILLLAVVIVCIVLIVKDVREERRRKSKWQKQK